MNDLKNYIEVLSRSGDPVPAGEVLRWVMRDPDFHYEDGRKAEDTGFGTIDFNKIIPETEVKCHECRYDWRRKHWGTETNACYNYLKPEEFAPNLPLQNRLVFNTGDYPVLKVVSKLSKMFPKYSFRYSWWDMDDFGASAGTYRFFIGRPLEARIYLDFSKEAFGFIFALEGKTAAEMDYAWSDILHRYIRTDDLEEKEKEELERQKTNTFSL
jgi:hypothetical protein